MIVYKLFQLHIIELNKKFNKILKKRSKSRIYLSKNLYIIFSGIIFSILVVLFHFTLKMEYDFNIKKKMFSTPLNFYSLVISDTKRSYKIEILLLICLGIMIPFVIMYLIDFYRIIYSNLSNEVKNKDMSCHDYLGLIFQSGVILMSLIFYFTIFFSHMNLRGFWLFASIMPILLNSFMLYLIFSYLDCLFSHYHYENTEKGKFSKYLDNSNSKNIFSCQYITQSLSKNNSFIIVGSVLGSLWFCLKYFYHSFKIGNFLIILLIMIFIGFAYITYLCYLNVIILRYIYMLKFQKQLLTVDEIISFIYTLFLLIWYSFYYIWDLIHTCNYITTNDYIFISIFLDSFLCLMLLLVFNGRAKYDAELFWMSLERKRIFVRHVSHEIKTPLNTCILGIKLLNDELIEHFKGLIYHEKNKNYVVINNNKTNTNSIDIEDKSKEYNFKKLTCLNLIKDINNSCLIAVDILNDLLLYEKLDGGIIECELSEVCLVDLVINTIKVFRMHAQYLKIDMVFKKVPNNSLEKICIVNIDKYKIGQVLRNLLSNALKFTPPKGKITIWAEILRQDDMIENSSPSSYGKNLIPEEKKNKFSSKFSGLLKKSMTQYIRICVKDSGVGISKANQKLLFNEIIQFNAKELQKGQGSGLGLWISNKIVRMHGGKIGCFSQGEGKGSIFYIDLPIHRFDFSSSISGDEVSEISEISEISSKDSDDSESDECKKEFPKNPSNSIISIKESNNLENYRETLKENIKDNICEVEADLKDLEKKSLESQMSKQESDVLANKIALIVDDSCLNRKVLKKFIEKKMKCDEAVDGLEATKMIQKDLDYYDIIFMDYFMPNLNGPDATQAIRKLGYKGVIIGLTGLDHDDSLINFIDSGANQIILKPINFENFWSVVNFEFTT